MTEREWLEYERPGPMLEALGAGLGESGLRLFACACVRRAWPSLIDARSRRAVEVAERYADGEATARELRAARGAARAGVRAVRVKLRRAAAAAADTTAPFLSWVQCRRLAEAVADHFAYSPVADGGRPREVEEAAQAALLRDVAGNPFGRVAFDPSWRAWEGGTVPRLAQAVYEEGAFERLPILGDALEEAGCADGRVLDHCRSAGEHGRGCWVLGLCLGNG